MLRKFMLVVLVLSYGILVYPDVSTEKHTNERKLTVVEGSFVRAAIEDLTTWVVAPKQWRIEDLVALKPEPEPEPVLPQVIAPEEPVFQKPTFAYADLVLPISEKYGVDWRLVVSVMEVESGFNPKAVSEKGALGLMQLMPGTARIYKVASHELFDPRRNLEAGIQHLRMLTDRYPGKMEFAVAAYNSGEGAVDRYRGIPPFKPTRLFVHRVMSKYQVHMGLGASTLAGVPGIGGAAGTARVSSSR